MPFKSCCPCGWLFFSRCQSPHSQTCCSLQHSSYLTHTCTGTCTPMQPALAPLQITHPERSPAYVAPFGVEERQTVLAAFAAVAQVQRECLHLPCPVDRTLLSCSPCHALPVHGCWASLAMRAAATQMGASRGRRVAMRAVDAAPVQPSVTAATHFMQACRAPPCWSLLKRSSSRTSSRWLRGRPLHCWCWQRRRGSSQMRPYRRRAAQRLSATCGSSGALGKRCSLRGLLRLAV